MALLKDDERGFAPFYGEDTDEVRAFMDRCSCALFFVALFAAVAVVVFG